MRSGKGLYGDKSRTRERHHNQLRNAVTRIYDKRFDGIEIDQSDANLATVGSVDGSRRIDDRNTVLCRQPAAGNDEGDEAVWQRDRQSSSHGGSLPWSEREGIRRRKVGARVSGVRNRGGIFSGKENLDNVSHAIEASKDAVPTKSWSDSEVTYRETLWPNPWIYLAFFLEAPMVIMLLAPFSLPLGILLASVIFVVIAVTMTITSPRIEIADGRLRVGKASIGLEYVGAASAFTGTHAVAERGPELDARAWTRFRAWIAPVVRVDITDDADPTPYWLFSTRRPEQLVTVLRASRAHHKA
jgi:hypothetical protein